MFCSLKLIFEDNLTEFDRAVHPQQNVVALDVSVNDLIRVQKLQRLETLHGEEQADESRHVSAELGTRSLYFIFSV